MGDAVGVRVNVGVALGLGVIVDVGDWVSVGVKVNVLGILDAIVRVGVNVSAAELLQALNQ